MAIWLNSSSGFEWASLSSARSSEVPKWSSLQVFQPAGPSPRARLARHPVIDPAALRGSRIAQFDGLRALAFLGVFAFHAVAVPYAWMGVDLFFVLSGYLITKNLLALRETARPRSALAVFYFRRLLRIVPPYYLALANLPTDAQETAACLRRAIERADRADPAITSPRLQLATLLIQDARYDEAAELLRLVRVREPGNAQAIYLTGLLQAGRGDLRGGARAPLDHFLFGFEQLRLRLLQGVELIGRIELDDHVPFLDGAARVGERQDPE